MPPSLSPAQTVALNKAAFAEALANLERVIEAAAGPGAEKGLVKVGTELVNEIKRTLSKPGGGRTYVRRGRSGSGSVRHTASSPGAPPAVDTGRLRASINMKAGSEKGKPFVDVGTNVQYAPFLEFGTSRMQARPYMRTALAAITEKARGIIARSVTEAEGVAIRTMPRRTV